MPVTRSSLATTHSSPLRLIEQLAVALHRGDPAAERLDRASLDGEHLHELVGWQRALALQCIENRNAGRNQIGIGVTSAADRAGIGWHISGVVLNGSRFGTRCFAGDAILRLGHIDDGSGDARSRRDAFWRARFCSGRSFL